MRFAQSNYVFGFWVVLGLVLFLIWALRSKRKAMRRFAEDKLLEEIAAQVDSKKQLIKSVLILGALILGMLALARPQWGFRWHQVKAEGMDILIAIDVSKSMLAYDVKPNRLERSKLAVKDLLRKLKGDRVGLIAFSGTAFLQCPLTIDYSGFLSALNDLSVDTIPRGGTSISTAIKKAMAGYEGGQKKYKVLVIISDGEDHEGNPIALAKEAKRENIKIFCIGIGTAEGELLQVAGEDGKKAFMKDKEGNVIKSRLNEEILQKIAVITGGSYVRSSGAEFGLDLIYEERLSKMEKREIKAQMSKLYQERFQIPLAVALVLLIIEPFISDKKKL